MQILVAKNGFHGALIKIELSVEVFGCRPSLGRTRNSLEEAARRVGAGGGGRLREKLPFPFESLLCVYACVYTGLTVDLKN